MPPIGVAVVSGTAPAVVAVRGSNDALAAVGAEALLPPHGVGSGSGTAPAVAAVPSSNNAPRCCGRAASFFNI